MASQTSALESTASFELKSVSERAHDTDSVGTRPTLSRAPSYDDDEARVTSAPDGGLRAWLVLCGAFVLTFFYGGYTYSFGIFQAAFEKRDLASTPILVILGSIPVFFLAITAIRAHMPFPSPGVGSSLTVGRGQPRMFLYNGLAIVRLLCSAASLLVFLSS